MRGQAQGGAADLSLYPTPPAPALESDEGEDEQAGSIEATAAAEEDCDAIEDLDAWFQCEDQKRIALGM